MLASIPFSVEPVVSSMQIPAFGSACSGSRPVCGKQQPPFPQLPTHHCLEGRVNSGFSAAIGDKTPASKIDHLISPAFSPKELAGNCEQAFKICPQGHSGEEDIFALPIRSPTAAEKPSGRRPGHASSGSVQTMAAVPPATEESSVSYEELNDLNAEFDDAETELSMAFPS